MYICMHGLFYASFSILNMCGMYVGLFYTNHNLVDEWHMFGNLDKYGNLPDCHQWTHIYHWWCRAGAKLVMCAYFSELETYVYNASLLRDRWGAVCFPIVSLHNSKIGQELFEAPCWEVSVAPSGVFQIDPISSSRFLRLCRHTNCFWIRNDIIHPASRSHVIWAPLRPNYEGSEDKNVETTASLPVRIELFMRVALTKLFPVCSGDFGGTWMSSGAGYFWFQSGICCLNILPWPFLELGEICPKLGIFVLSGRFLFSRHKRSWVLARRQMDWDVCPAALRKIRWRALASKSQLPDCSTVINLLSDCQTCAIHIEMLFVWFLPQSACAAP